MKFKFDEYSRKARIAPALIAAAPTLFLLWYASRLGLSGLGFLIGALPLVFVGAFALLTEQIVRPLGRRLEKRLVKAWDGLPTTSMLRLSGARNVALVERRRADVERVVDFKLPVKSDEEGDPDVADELYADAVRRANAAVVRAGDRRLLDENIQYGFRRNLLALKPFALTLLVISFGTNTFLTYIFSDLAAGASIAILIVIVTGVWLLVVRRPWVREQADTFAQRFFDSVATHDR